MTRRAVEKIIGLYGIDRQRIAEVALTAAVRTAEDLAELNAFQVRRPRGGPPIARRPRSPAMVTLETAHRSADYAA